MNSQFPPSSPLLNNEEHLKGYRDAFDDSSIKNIQSLNRLKSPLLSDNNDNDNENAYITPDPSSSFMVSDNLKSDELMHQSSPVPTNNTTTVLLNETKRGNDNNVEPLSKKQKVNTHLKTQCIDSSKPLSRTNFHNVLEVLNYNGKPIHIGRSGLSCNYKLNSSNKLISRVHAEISIDKDDGKMILLKCLGFNGLNITIPKSIKIELIKDKSFLIKIEDKENNSSFEVDEDETDDESTSRVLSKSSKFINFYMLKGESIKMPMIEGTILDFRGDLVYLSFNEKSSKNPNNDMKEKDQNFCTYPTLTELKNNLEIETSNTPKPIERKNLPNIIVYKAGADKNEEASGEYKLKASSGIDANTSNLASKKGEVNEGKEDSNTNIDNVDFDSTARKMNEANENKEINSIEITPNAKMNIKENKDSIIENLKAMKIFKPDSAKDSSSMKNFKLKKVKTSGKSIHADDSIKTPTINLSNKTLSTPKTPVKAFNGNERKPLADLNILNTPTPSNDLKHKIMKTVMEMDSPNVVKEKQQQEEDKENEDHKKRGRPSTKKQVKSEEETLRNMPQEDIDNVLETVPELEDISNIVTNHLAYSRVLQTPFKQLIELNSIKKHNLSKLQLRCILIHHVSCIGVIFRQGKDAAGKLLDEEYYYVPENDEDITRVKLVEELKGSSSHIRSCRKTHKQYFWKKPKI